ncbi:MAG: class I SAM-dependent methyltransferase [Clostridiaceae bacterium]|nr:class I SAM-dependent methyltransferase [Clostridiaceae bacterium]
MQDVDYDRWVDYIQEVFNRFNVKPKLVLELACGTGNICTRMAQRGYEMIGLDLSADMLNVALSKTDKLGLDILYLMQDMTEFELYGTVDAVLCLMDSLNYLLSEEELLKTFKLVSNYLNPGGLFLFDLNSRYKLKKILGNNTFAVEEDEIFYVWDNNYDEKTEICEFYLTFFVREGEKYRRIDEIHRERAYKISTVKNLLKQAGLAFLGCYEPFTFDKAQKNSERLFIIAKQCVDKAVTM